MNYSQKSTEMLKMLYLRSQRGSRWSTPIFSGFFQDPCTHPSTKLRGDVSSSFHVLLPTNRQRDQQTEVKNGDLSLCGSDPSRGRCAGFLRSAGWRTCEPDCVFWGKCWDRRGHTGSPSHSRWTEPGSLAAHPPLVPVEEGSRIHRKLHLPQFHSPCMPCTVWCRAVPSQCQQASRSQWAAPWRHGWISPAQLSAQKTSCSGLELQSWSPDQLRKPRYRPSLHKGSG